MSKMVLAHALVPDGVHEMLYLERGSRAMVGLSSAYGMVVHVIGLMMMIL